MSEHDDLLKQRIDQLARLEQIRITLPTIVVIEDESKP